MSESLRNFCYTYHVREDEDPYIMRSKFLQDKIKYLICNIEVCPTTNKIHLQGYAVLNIKTTLKQVKKILNLGDTVHIENRKGSHDEARNYCMKDESKLGGSDPLEYGEYNPGKRNDITEVKTIIKNGGNMRQVVEITESYQAVKMAETYLKYHEKPRCEKPTVKWYWGPTGSGKTKLAFEESNDNDRWISGKNLKWFEGYDGHTDVIIDDFRADFCTFHEFLRILDRYEFRIEVKGGSRQFKPINIWITSCFPPDKVYQTREDIGQLLRRIDEIRYIGPELKTEPV